MEPNLLCSLNMAVMRKNDLCCALHGQIAEDIPYILESNPCRFYGFRGLQNQMQIIITCGLDSQSRAGFWKNDRATVRAVRTIQSNNLLFYLLLIIIYYSSDSPSSLITESLSVLSTQSLSSLSSTSSSHTMSIPNNYTFELCRI
jgi:hypothetical protein